jgi:DNA adenine methylase
VTEARGTAAPVLKWAGGKRQIVKQILELLPQKIATYYEPFVGGGAVFFELYNRGSFERAVIGDKNPELVNVYQSLKHDVSGVIRALKKLKEQHSEEHYYKVRATIPRSETARAARVLYLNKTGFNGLYRVNRSGQFNVPFGRYDEPKIVNEPRLRAAAEALANVEILNEDFEVLAGKARSGDAVYFDPPYLPVSATAAFAEYYADPFGIVEHRKLAKVFDGLSRKGIAAVLSNSDTPVTRGLFEKYQLQIVSVSVRRAINSVATRRGGVGEILVTGARTESRARAIRARTT